MQSWSSATGRSGTASADPRPEAPASEFEAVPRHQCRNGIRLDWSSIGRLPRAERRGSRGNTTADPGRLPAGDSPGRVPSTWRETAVPSRAAQGRGPRPRWARAHEPGRARAHPAGPRALPGRPARARVLGAARPDVLLGLGAPERAHGTARGGAAAGPAGPPLRPVPVMPLAHEARPAAPGARVRLPARPAGPVGHLRAQKPYEPPPLVVRPAPSPLAASCQASRVSPRHVFSLTTS